MLSSERRGALLKTLEEPPEHVVFVLATTDPQKVAPTIRSRTQHFEFTLLTVDEIARAPRRRRAPKEGVEASPKRWRSSPVPAAGSMRDSLSLLDQAIAHGALDVEQVSARSFGGSPFDGRVASCERSPTKTSPARSSALGELLDAGHEPRRLAEDLLRDAARRVPAHVGEWDGCASTPRKTTWRALARARRSRWVAAMLVRDTRDARPGGGRHARRRRRRPAPGARDRARAPGAPRSGHRRSRRSPNGSTGSNAAVPTVAATPTRRPVRDHGRPCAKPLRADAAGPASGRSLSELQRDRAATPAPPSRFADARELRCPAPQPAGCAAPDRRRHARRLDDVILAWAAILPAFPPVTRAAAQEAQPIAVDGNVVTFGVPKNLFDATKKRFQEEADAIRERLTAQLGRVLRFKMEPVDGFGSLTPSSPPPSASPPSTAGNRRRAAAARRRGDRSERAHRHGDRLMRR